MMTGALFRFSRLRNRGHRSFIEASVFSAIENNDITRISFTPYKIILNCDRFDLSENKNLGHSISEPAVIYYFKLLNNSVKYIISNTEL